MPPKPLYHIEDLRPAFQLRYGWTGWLSKAPFPCELLARLLPEITPEWENDGIRVLESTLAPEKIQLTLSTRPQLSPITLVARVKGRIQHHCRRNGFPIDFSRKLAVRSLGDPTRAQVEAYVRNQVANANLADERLRQRLAAFTIVNPDVDLSKPMETNSGRYWYNLHLVLVTNDRYRIDATRLFEKIQITARRICDKKGYAVSTLAVLPDHLHMAIRGAIDESPEAIAWAFLNNLAYALGQQPWFAAGYYAGTFGEYSMAAVRHKEADV